MIVTLIPAAVTAETVEWTSHDLSPLARMVTPRDRWNGEQVLNLSVTDGAGWELLEARKRRTRYRRGPSTLTLGPDFRSEFGVPATVSVEPAEIVAPPVGQDGARYVTWASRGETYPTVVLQEAQVLRVEYRSVIVAHGRDYWGDEREHRVPLTSVVAWSRRPWSAQHARELIGTSDEG